MLAGTILWVGKDICSCWMSNFDKCGVGRRNWSVFCIFLFSDGASDDIFTIISEDLAGWDFILLGLI